MWRVQYTQPSLYQAKESADAAKKKVLWAEVRKEAATVSDVKLKVGKDKAAAVAEEDRELLEVEEAVLTSVVGKDTAGVVSKFFKQQSLQQPWSFCRDHDACLSYLGAFGGARCGNTAEILSAAASPQRLCSSRWRAQHGR